MTDLKSPRDFLRHCQHRSAALTAVIMMVGLNLSIWVPAFLAACPLWVTALACAACGIIGALLIPKFLDVWGKAFDRKE
jgi:hypothetical protein